MIQLKTILLLILLIISLIAAVISLVEAYKAEKLYEELKKKNDDIDV